MNKKEQENLELYSTWKRKIDNALTYHEEYWQEAEKYQDIYRDQYNNQNVTRYNVFYANTETLSPLIYSKLPKPNITRRYSDDDELARIASEMIERAVSYFLETTKANYSFARARKDFLIVGRGIVRLYYEAGEIYVNENGEEIPDEEKELYLKVVSYKNFLADPSAKCWEDVDWIAFRHYKNKHELEELFGKEIAKDIKLDATQEQGEEKPSCAMLWEIWDEEEKKVIWFAQDKIIQVDDDPYELEDFFPVAKPVGSDSDPTCLLPIPLYRMYKSQAEDLNRLDARISSLIEQVKVCGVYASMNESNDIENILNGEDGQYSPLTPVASGNIKDQIYTKDVVPIINAIAQLNDQKARIINNIREITGISDIVRGVSIASETATAQRLKGDFAISRIQPLQKANDYMIRDTIRLMAELIVENFSIEELVKITNCKIVDLGTIAQTTREKQMALLQEAINNLPSNLSPQEAVQQQEMLKKQAEIGFNKTMKIAQDELKGYAIESKQVPLLEKMLKDDKVRSFAVDIETDSTISVDQQQVKQDRIEFIGAITNFTSQFFPLLQAGIIQPEAFNQFLGFMARPFKVGRNLEEFLLAKPDAEEEQAQNQPSMQEQLAMAESQRKDQELQFKMQVESTKLNIEQQKVDIEKAKVLQNQRQFDDKIDFDDANKAADRQANLLAKVAPTAENIINQRTERVNQTIRGNE